ncbi:unnamed protein product [Nyctereutes procyonoides]|uniref:(raccoon dog) hypothetical protein n=1 Tax=Nyctereutes procyonoides TaxID=34880 RepID=A0A811ZQU2_NYCPR|nr:unnamed protein product [Nyctereutes procyonoides]
MAEISTLTTTVQHSTRSGYDPCGKRQKWSNFFLLLIFMPFVLVVPSLKLWSFVL